MNSPSQAVIRTVWLHDESHSVRSYPSFVLRSMYGVLPYRLRESGDLTRTRRGLSLQFRHGGTNASVALPWRWPEYPIGGGTE